VIITAGRLLDRGRETHPVNGDCDVGKRGPSADSTPGSIGTKRQLPGVSTRGVFWAKAGIKRATKMTVDFRSITESFHQDASRW
jgi:hypothetical protein